MFVPTSAEELIELNIKQLDIIFITGDVYIDVSNDGVALLSKFLISKGFTVGIISQPILNSDIDISRLGEPRLFWGVSAGCVDSMVANYTSLNKPRKRDDLTPGGINNKRPDRATIQYVNLIKKYYKSRKAIVIGGIEASLRRIAHYDYWTDSIRRSILFDSKADFLVYGMAEKSIVELANYLREKANNLDNNFENNVGNIDLKKINGISYLSNEAPDTEDYIELPEFQLVKNDKNEFTKMFNLFYQNCDPISAKGLFQKTDNRYLIQNPPQAHLSTEEIDEIYSLDFEHDVHPYYKKMGNIPALNTVQFSITTHRGCFGECSFCAIALHQGRTIISRSKKSIIDEIQKINKNRNFKGIISDLGGATANMYSMKCEVQCKVGSCKNKSCISPSNCRNMKINHKELIDLLKEARAVPGVKKIFIASGIRYDMILEDKKYGNEYLRTILKYHISGQMKIAPEHINEKVLHLMNKPKNDKLLAFIDKFKAINNELEKKQFLTYYFIAAHPGSGEKENTELQQFICKELNFSPEQIQVFSPTPSTYSTLQYYTEKSNIDQSDIYVEKKNSLKALQKSKLQLKNKNKLNTTTINNLQKKDNLLEKNNKNDKKRKNRNSRW